MSQVTVPEGKILDKIDGTLRNDTPEEYVRQTIERRLLDELRYKPARISVEYGLKIGSQRPRADLVIWDDGAEHLQDNVKIIIECKNSSIPAESSKDGIEQLKSYMAVCPACEWGMWTNSLQKFVFRKEINSAGEVEYVEYNDIPTADGRIIERPKRGELINASDDNLLFVFRTCHNHIYANDGLHKQQAFFEFLKIIFCKIQDERNLPTMPIEFYATSKERRNPDGQLTVKNRIETIFDSVKKSYATIFAPNEKINLTPRSLAYIVSSLQNYNLLNTHVDIKGKAYEEIVGSNLRGDRGEFFTPRNIMKMTVEMINPGINEKVLDSSCGTGGFLVMALTHMIETLQFEFERGLGLPKSQWSTDQTRAFDDKKRELAASQYYGFDLNPDLAKATRMNMVMNNDGSGNILQVNSLLPPHMWPEDFKAHIAKALGIDAREIRNHNNIGLFDVIVTNPPFGSKIPIRDEAILEQYELARIWEYDNPSGKWTMTDRLQSSVPPEILFIERCTQFLKEGGRMGIILPDSILGAPSLGYIRQWILVNHTVIASIDLTPDTFQPHNGTQTSVLLLQKKTEQEKNNEAKLNHIANYPIFMAVIDRVGHDRRGNPLYKFDEEGYERLEDGEKVIDDQTKEVTAVFREWAEKKNDLYLGVEVKGAIAWVGEILRDGELRLEASNFAGRQDEEEGQDTGGKYPVVKFEKLASCYLCGREGKVLQMKTTYPFYSSSNILDVRPETDSYLSPDKPRKIEEFRVYEGQILLSRSGTIGRVVYVSKTLDGKYVNSHALRLTCYNPNDAGYIYAYLKTPAARKILQALAFGAVVQHIAPRHLNTIPVPYAPEDMRRKINELVVKSYALRDQSNTKLDEAESLLVRSLALPSMEDIRREVWRDSDHARIFEVMNYELEGRFEASYHDPVYGVLLDYVRAGASEVLTVGDERVSSKIILPGRFKRVYVGEGYGAVFIGGKQIGELDPSDKKYLAFSQHEKRIREELTIHTDMILITCSGTIGRAALVPEHWDGWTASQHVMRVVPASRDIAGYAYVWLASEWGRELLRRCRYGAVIDEINDEHVAGVPFPLVRDSGVLANINGLALEASALRSEAWRLEREAVALMEDIVNPS